MWCCCWCSRQQQQQQKHSLDENAGQIAVDNSLTHTVWKKITLFEQKNISRSRWTGLGGEMWLSECVMCVSGWKNGLPHQTMYFYFFYFATNVCCRINWSMKHDSKLFQSGKKMSTIRIKRRVKCECSLSSRRISDFKTLIAGQQHYFLNWSRMHWLVAFFFVCLRRLTLDIIGIWKCNGGHAII